MTDFNVDLSGCSNVHQLAAALGIDADVLAQLASAEAADFYRKHTIPKRSRHRKNEVREVFEPATEELRQIHKTLNRRLTLHAKNQDPTYPLPCCFGFVRQRSTLDNAARHLGQPLLLRLDIENFFPTISVGRVQEVLATLKIQLPCRDALSRVLCFTGFLVPGLSASPLLANLATRGLDKRLTEIANSFGARYTRYADDIAISGKEVPAASQVAMALELEGYRLSPRKQRLTKPGQDHFVTGLSVQDTKRPHVPKPMKRRLRQEIFYCSKYGIDDHLLRIGHSLTDGLNRLDGTVRYVSYIERDTAFDFGEKWDALLARDDRLPQIPSNYALSTEPWFCAVDETIIERPEGHYLAMGFSLFEDRALVESRLCKIRDDYLASPFVTGKKSAIKKNGLHWADATASLKEKIVDQLPSLPMRMLVGWCKLSSRAKVDVGAAYLRVLDWGIADVLRRTDRKELTLYVEKCSAIAHAKVQGAITATYSVREKMGTPRPMTAPVVEMVGKGSMSVALTDSMLGILASYVRDIADADRASTALVQFEQVRDRFSLIHDLDNRQYFCRRNPLEKQLFGTPTETPVTPPEHRSAE